MLEILTKSKIRQRIILLYIYNQNREFYLSEIAKAVGTSVGTAQRELNKLSSIDLLRFKKRAGLNIYTLNKNYSLLNELESIIKKTLGIEVELKNELGKIGGIAFAFLFGSYVKGGFKSDSDIDLFIIDGKEDQIFKVIQKIEKIVSREINPHFASKEEFIKKAKTSSFHKDIIKNHILLIGDENEFRKLIK